MTSWTPDTCSGLAEAAGLSLRPGGLELTQHLLGFALFEENSRILDAGCGLGVTARYLSQHRKVTAVGVDNSESMLTEAQRLSGEARLVCASLESLPFGSESFDGIICECVLSQTAVDAVLSEFHRVVRPGGLLLLSDLYLKSACPNPVADPAPAHPFSTKDQIGAMLDDAGFVVEHWEDRTGDLRQLAIQLIMAGSGQEHLSGWIGLSGCCAGSAGNEIRRNLGYHLLVARKRSL